MKCPNCKSTDVHEDMRFNGNIWYCSHCCFIFEKWEGNLDLKCSKCGKESGNLQLIQDSVPLKQKFFGYLCPECFKKWCKIWDKYLFLLSGKGKKYDDAWDKHWDDFLNCMYDRVS